MSSVFFDHKNLGNECARRLVYEGNIFLTSEFRGVACLSEFARSMIKDAFPNLDPQKAQFDLPVEGFVKIVAALKTAFTNHPRTKELLQEVFSELACDLDRTYFDVPRMRVATHGGYLTAGVGYAYKPHRDIWYSSPVTQVNWWVPIYSLTAPQALVFYPSYFNASLRNSSAEFDYGEWCQVGRQQAINQIEVDTRKHPLVEEEVSPDAELRLVCDADAAICFSSAQLHATAPNDSGLTRFSFDFRTINIDDLVEGKGAHNVDSAATGTTLGDFIRASDFTPIPKELVQRYLQETK